MGHWQNDTDRKVKYSEKSLFQYHFITIIGSTALGGSWPPLEVS
jgi:hypothetical protein